MIHGGFNTPLFYAINKLSCVFLVNFSIKFDSRSKEVLLDCLKKELNLAEDEIRNGDYSESALLRHEELFQLIRGILYSRPELEKFTGPIPVKPDDETGVGETLE